MTLTSRLSLFFLATLGAVLVGFSAVLYFLARDHLYRQAGDRLETAADTLVAAIEFEPDGLAWEPEERSVRLGPGTLGEQISWRVTDENGRVIDQSTIASSDLLARTAEGTVVWEGQPWQLTRRSVNRATAGKVGGPRLPLGPDKYTALTITAAVPLGPVASTLQTLAATLILLSTVVLGVALVAARFVCRRALVPVSRMANAARSLGAITLNERLPVSAARDELADLGQAFNDLLGRLEESFERQQRFTGDASHQLRTPLTAILGQVEVALRRDRSSEDYRQVLARVQKQADHLRQVVEVLLFLARADHEARLPDLAPVDLSQWLPEHLQSWAGHPRFGDMKIEAMEGPIMVGAQVPLLHQLIDNLIDNACKYSQPGTSISIRLAHENGAALLAVQDAGLGIATEDVPHIFEPFYRSADARRHGLSGTGLGLAVAKRIALSLGGGLEVESRVGEGSRFTLRLPVNAVEENSSTYSMVSGSEQGNSDERTGMADRHRPNADAGVPLAQGKRP